jgi:hypothetical protein
MVIVTNVAAMTIGDRRRASVAIARRANEDEAGLIH